MKQLRLADLSEAAVQNRHLEAGFSRSSAQLVLVSRSSSFHPFQEMNWFSLARCVSFRSGFFLWAALSVPCNQQQLSPGDSSFSGVARRSPCCLKIKLSFL